MARCMRWTARCAKRWIRISRHWRRIRLTDFKVRVVNVRAGTAARVRVLVETTDEQGDTWSTVGVHENIILASLEALCDALHYGIRKMATCEEVSA